MHTTNGGASWTAQAGSGAPHLFGVACANGLTAWAVGLQGTILHTTDGGTMWQEQHSGVVANLHCTVFFDADTGLVFGGDPATGEAVILRTTNGGQDWNRRPCPANTWILDAKFADRFHGWAVGGSGHIFETIDGGQTWTCAPQLGTTDLSSLCLAGSHNAFAVGSGGDIYHTTDGWVSSEQQSSDVGAQSFFGVSFVDPLRGWAAGRDASPDRGAILHTTDGGFSWQAQAAVTEADLYDIQFWNREYGWAVGGLSDHAVVLHTSDGGDSWVAQSAALDGPLYSVCFVDALTGWAAGTHTDDQAAILHTTNGGTTWAFQNVTGVRRLEDIAFVNRFIGWAVGEANTILHTTDGGSTWSAQGTASGFDLHTVTFQDAATGWAAGHEPDHLASIVLHTSDGGTTWVRQHFADNGEGLLDMAFSDRLHGWAVGHFGALLSTTDGGVSWIVQNPVSASDLNAVAFLPDGNGFAVGEGGTILHLAGASIITPGQGPRPVIAGYELSAYPNPFNPNTLLSFDIPVRSKVQLAIFDLMGRKVTTLADQIFAPGAYRVDFDGSRLPSGIYFARLQGSSFSKTHKLVLLK